jgi:rhomboid protease GluP
MAATRMCPHCRAFVEPSEKVCPYCEGPLGATARQRARGDEPVAGLIPATHFTTFIILALNFGIFVAMLVLSSKLGGGNVLDIRTDVADVFGAKNRLAILVYGQWWRLITAGFLHAGIFHILMNSWVLYDLGAQVEQIYGTARFLAIYLISSVGGFFASLWWSPALSLGASAALCGLIGAMMAYGKRSGQSFVLSFYMRWVIIIAVMGLIPGFNIDNAAHFGGLAVGFAIAYVAAPLRPNPAQDAVWKAIATVAVLTTAWAMAIAWLNVTAALR